MNGLISEKVYCAKILEFLFDVTPTNPILLSSVYPVKYTSTLRSSNSYVFPIFYSTILSKVF